MQVTHVKAACDLDAFGKIGIYNWDVSSLTDRRQDAHRRALYHTEYGPYWDYDLALTSGWTLHSGVLTCWTVYDGFKTAGANKCYWWTQFEQSLANPYLTPYYRLRRCTAGSDYFYARLGVRRKFTLWRGLYFSTDVSLEGGNDRNQNRVFGKSADGSSVGSGFYTLAPHFELGYAFGEHFTLYAWVEQYEVLGSARSVNADYSYRCAHNDWTLGGLGLRIRF